jgi:hypothetical protein
MPTTQSGPSFIQDATIYNVERFLGWVTTTDALCTLGQLASPFGLGFLLALVIGYALF